MTKRRRPRDLGNDLFRVRIGRDKRSMIAETVRPLDLKDKKDRREAQRLAWRILDLSDWFE